jgi:hypothetical protein
MEVQVEVRVLDPVGQIDPERHLHEAPAERRQQVQPLPDQPADVLHRQLTARRRRRVVHGEAADVPVRPRRLDGEELGVERRELAHAQQPV